VELKYSLTLFFRDQWSKAGVRVERVPHLLLTGLSRMATDNVIIPVRRDQNPR
jgi:hypothetical protein